MKDAKGHGSEKRGGLPAHQSGIASKVQEFMRNESGAGKVPGFAKHAADKMHEPEHLAHFLSEAAHGNPGALVHLMHIIGMLAMIISVRIF